MTMWSENFRLVLLFSKVLKDIPQTGLRRVKRLEGERYFYHGDSHRP
jgi:hypothetical protein